MLSSLKDWLFMPKMAAMKASGSCSNKSVSKLQACRECRLTYKDNRDDSEYHDGSSLLHSFFAMTNGLPRLKNACLLLLECEQMI
jgi:hypothetical protein